MFEATHETFEKCRARLYSGWSRAKAGLGVWRLGGPTGPSSMCIRCKPCSLRVDAGSECEGGVTELDGHVFLYPALKLPLRDPRASSTTLLRINRSHLLMMGTGQHAVERVLPWMSSDMSGSCATEASSHAATVAQKKTMTADGMFELVSPTAIYTRCFGVGFRAS